MLGKRLFTWLGAEVNARAITTLLTIGTGLGAFSYFLFDRIAPQISPQWSQMSYGEGYRLGRREAELEISLHTAKQSLRALRTKMEVDERVRNMTDRELNSAIKRWVRD
jgi:hypothetical protein